MNLKNINLGKCIRMRVEELDISTERICNFFKLDEQAITEMYNESDLKTDIVLRWSKLLEYDFFRLYSQHLIMYSPPTAQNFTRPNEKSSQLPQFRKNVYTKEIIGFILELIETGVKTKAEVINQYKIPKTTLYKWIDKYGRNALDTL